MSIQDIFISGDLIFFSVCSNGTQSADTYGSGSVAGLQCLRLFYSLYPKKTSSDAGGSSL